MIEIKIPADNKPLAAAIGRALVEYGAGVAVAPTEANNEGDPIGGDCPNETPADPSASRADTATAAAGSTETQTSADAGAAQCDNKGVPKNDQFCSSAAKPFYASGPRSGQWKKRQGLPDEAYDAWYTGELAKYGATTATTTTQDVTLDTAGAFGGQAAATASTETVPHDSGTLMAWVAERQTAGVTSQTDVNTAWTTCGLSMTDIFAPNTPELIAENCSRVYYAICKLAGE